MHKIREVVEYVKLIPIKVFVWYQVKLWDIEYFMDDYFKWRK